MKYVVIRLTEQYSKLNDMKTIMIKVYDDQALTYKLRLGNIIKSIITDRYTSIDESFVKDTITTDKETVYFCEAGTITVLKEQTEYALEESKEPDINFED